MTETQLDCVVLSGGGATGAFGSGAARAIRDFHRDIVGHERQTCYIGTSAGALNAAVLAAFSEDGAERLRQLWTNANAKSVVGESLGRKKDTRRIMRRLLWRAFLGKEPFYLFDTKALRQLVSEALKDVDFGSLDEAPLVLVATCFDDGRIRSFYTSSLIDEVVRKDREAADREGVRQKLSRFKRIDSKEMLIECLLASAAIPVLFPLVEINGNWYGDGGIANNTPVQEAALLLRVVKECSITHLPGDTFCIMQNPNSRSMELEERGLKEVALSTYELAQTLHMGPILASWHQINKSVQDYSEAVAKLEEAGHIAADGKDRLLPAPGGYVPRLSLPLYEIRPTGELGGLLDFRSADYDLEGYAAAVDALHQARLVEDHERERLSPLPSSSR